MVHLSNSRITFSILIFLLVIIFSTCEDLSEVTLNNELIFPAAREIKIPSYTYQSIAGEISIRGDEGFEDGFVDTITSTPTLKWDSVQTELVVSAIFTGPIQESNGKIENTDEMIWIWHSGLEDGKNGWVKFEEGRSISNGSIENLSQAIPLPDSHQYYWGVWGWNESGIKILYSSRQMTFYVK